MLYCSSCQMLTEGDCPICHKKAKKMRAPQANDPVFFYFGGFMNASMVEPLLISAGIPYSKIGSLGAALAMKTGSFFERFRFFVPYGALGHAIDEITGAFGADAEIMRGLNALAIAEQPALDNAETVREQYSAPDALDVRRALHARFTIAEIPFHDWLIGELRLEGGMKILDIGCGGGDLWARGDLPDGMDITLADMSQGMVDAARERTAEVTNQRFEYAVCDAQDLPFGDGEFDMVVAAHMLYHVPDIFKALSEIKRVLKPGGRLCATTMSGENMRELYAITDKNGILLAEPSRKFNMETGTALLSQFFNDVKLSRHESSLQVTEAEPLIAYVKSLATFTKQSDDALEKLSREIEKRISRDGSFDITKLACMFIAKDAREEYDE